MEELFDAIVIGSGIVGCATVRALALGGARCALVEKSHDLLTGASKGNSGIFHTGFDAPTGSLELALMLEGGKEFERIVGGGGGKSHFRVRFDRIGAHVVAWTEEQMESLKKIAEKSRKNGVTNVEMISADELKRREPKLASGALGALAVPGEGITDPFETPMAFLYDAVAAGTAVHTGFEVVATTYHGAEGWRMTSRSGQVLRAKVVVNCAGNYSDLVDALRAPGVKPHFHITPRKGQFVLLNRGASAHLRSVILPIPTARTKGVLLSPTVHGNVLVGPTAEDQSDRQFATVSKETVEALLKEAERMAPGITAHGVAATYAGLRPASQFPEYQIQLYADPPWITVGGIRSTGLTASLGIGAYVLRLIKQLPQVQLRGSTGGAAAGSVNIGANQRNDDHIAVGNVTHYVTHPVARIGRRHGLTSKL